MMFYLFYACCILTALLLIVAITSILLILMKYGKVTHTKDEALPTTITNTAFRRPRGLRFEYRKDLYTKSKGMNVGYSAEGEMWTFLKDSYKERGEKQYRGISAVSFTLGIALTFFTIGFGYNLYNPDSSAGYVFIVFSAIFLYVVSDGARISYHRVKQKEKEQEMEREEMERRYS